MKRRAKDHPANRPPARGPGCLQAALLIALGVIVVLVIRYLVYG